jgi:hypothetical protein
VLPWPRWGRPGNAGSPHCRHVSSLEADWAVTSGKALEGGNAAYVAEAVTADRQLAVLKIALPPGIDGFARFEQELRRLQDAGGDPYAKLMAGSVRERNLRGTPWLTMVIAEGEHPVHIAVIAEGPAEVITAPEVPADVRAAVTGDWVSEWIRLTAKRLLSYADENALPERP